MFIAIFLQVWGQSVLRTCFTVVYFFDIYKYYTPCGSLNKANVHSLAEGEGV